MAIDQEIESLAPELSRRLDAILSGIQGEADKMLEEARIEARRHVVDTSPQADEVISDRRRRLAQLSDDLIARSEQVLVQLDETARLRDSFARLLSALADAADRVAEEAQAIATLPPTASAPPPPPPTAIPRPTVELQGHAPLFASTTPPPEPVSPAPPAPPSSSSQTSQTVGPAAVVDRSWVEARQATIHMAAAGNTRGQVEAQLRDFLGVADPGSLLDQVFGAGSGADSRVPWAIAPTTPLRPRQ